MSEVDNDCFFLLILDLFKIHLKLFLIENNFWVKKKKFIRK